MFANVNEAPKTKTSPGLVFYLPYTFAGSRQNELYFNTLVLLILDCLFACHRLLRVLSHTVNILELFDYKLLYSLEWPLPLQTIPILILQLPLQLLHLQQPLRLRPEEQQSQHCRMSEPEWLLSGLRCCLQQPSYQQR